MFSVSMLASGPKHSTSVLSSVEVAVPLSVDEKELASFNPNPIPDIAVKEWSCPQIEEVCVLCTRTH